MLRSFLSILIMASVTAALAGCGDTYVNIPPEQGDVAAHDPNNAGVRQVMVEALKTVITDLPATGKIAVATPGGTTPLTEAAIVNQLGPRAVQAGGKTKAAIQVAVKAVRIRGTSAAVDIERPNGAGVRELVTVSMIWKPFNGWSVTDVQVWHNLAGNTAATQPAGD